MCALWRLTLDVLKQHFEDKQTKHEKTFKDEAVKAESIKCAVSRYGKQASTLKVFATAKHLVLKLAIALCIALRNAGSRSMMVNILRLSFVAQRFCLFDGLPPPQKKRQLKQQYKHSHVSQYGETPIQEMAKNVRAQETAGLKEATVFSVGLDESVYVNDMLHLAVLARYRHVTVQEELCCLKPVPETKGEDIARIFIEHFEEQNVDINKIFAVTTDGAPTVVGKQKGAVTLIEERVGHSIMKLHRIIHKENLCAKMSNSDLNDVMATVVKIVNVIAK